MGLVNCLEALERTGTTHARVASLYFYSTSSPGLHVYHCGTDNVDLYGRLASTEPPISTEKMKLSSSTTSPGPDHVSCHGEADVDIPSRLGCLALVTVPRGVFAGSASTVQVITKMTQVIGDIGNQGKLRWQCYHESWMPTSTANASYYYPDVSSPPE